MIFKSRASAGLLLAVEVAKRKYANPHIFALARGGVAVGLEVARILAAPLDVLVVRKLGLPGFPELGFGALAPGGMTELDRNIISRYMLHINDIENVKKTEQIELERRMKVYSAKVPSEINDQTVIVVDDGIATGITMLVALKYLKQFNPRKLVVAVPVCADTSDSQFHGLADEYVCLSFEEYFGAVGDFYDEFPQVSDAEVVAMLSGYDVTS